MKYSIKGVSVPSLKLVGMAVLMVRTSTLTQTLSTVIPPHLCLCVADGCDATEDVKIVNVMQQIVVTVIGTPEVSWGDPGRCEDRAHYGISLSAL